MAKNQKPKRKITSKKPSVKVKPKKIQPNRRKRKVKLEKPIKLEQQPSVEIVEQPKAQNKEIITEGVTKKNPITQIGGGYVEYDGKVYQEQALRELNQSLFAIQPDNGVRQSNTNFGITFPKLASKGDIFVRVDIMPNKVFKFDGNRWIEVNKQNTITYLDEGYIKYLIEKIDSGEYDTAQLTDSEEEQIRAYLATQKR